MSKKVAFLVAAAWAVAAACQAAELGALSIYSAAGEPFSARLSVSQVDPKVKPLMVRLAPPAVYARQGLTQSPDSLGLRVKLLSQNPYQVSITGKNAVMATSFPLIVELTDGTTQKAKLYTVHLKDRPAGAKTAAKSTAAAKTVASTNSAAKSAAPIEEPLSHSSKGTVVVRKGQTAWSVATSVREHYNNAPMNQLIVALVRKNPSAFENGSVAGLKGGSRLTLPTAAEVGAIDAATGWTYVRSETKANATKPITKAQRAKAAKVLGNAANRRVTVTEKTPVKTTQPQQTVRATPKAEAKPVKKETARAAAPTKPAAPVKPAAAPVAQTTPTASASAPVATVTAGAKAPAATAAAGASTVPQEIKVPMPGAEAGRTDNRAVAGSGYTEDVAEADAAAAKSQAEQTSSGSLWWLWVLIVIVLGGGAAGGWIWWKRRGSDVPALSQLRPIKFLRGGAEPVSTEQKAGMDDMLTRRMQADAAAARGIPGDPLAKREPAFGAAPVAGNERVEPSFGSASATLEVAEEEKPAAETEEKKPQTPEDAFKAALSEPPAAAEEKKEESEPFPSAPVHPELKLGDAAEPHAGPATPVQPRSAYGAAMKGHAPLTSGQWQQKLSTARDYMNIGATNEAAKLLKEVAQGGTNVQRREAQALLRRLGARG